ncbi:hypothetical protein ACWCXH_27955 [Kitasatospora sp. NPDC001660]
MSEPWSETSAAPQLPSSPVDPAATPKSLLEQMQELLASVTADLAELRSSGVRVAGTAAYPTGTDTSEAPAAAPGTR